MEKSDCERIKRMNWEAIFWYVVLADSVAANFVAWFFRDWYENNLGNIPRHFPATKSWCLIYLALVLWIGWALYREGTLAW